MVTEHSKNPAIAIFASMLQQYSSNVGQVLSYIYEHPQEFPDKALREALESLIQKLTDKSKTDGVESAISSLTDTAFDARWLLLKLFF